MKSSRITAAFALVIAAASCRESAPPARTDRPNVPSGYPVLGEFETRGQRVTWLSAGADARFTVRTLDGAVIGAELTEAQVSERFPELRDFVRSLLAKPDAPIFDASGESDY